MMNRGEQASPAQSHNPMRWALLLILSGCLGGLSYQALTVGNVSGQLTGSEAGGARVFLLDAGFVSQADSAGRFTLASVPAGSYRFIAIGTTTALSSTVVVKPGGSGSPASVSMTTASEVEAAVTGAGGGLSGVQVEIAGTPIAGTTDADGVVQLGVLPAGCFVCRAQGAFGSIQQTLCAVPPNPVICRFDLGGAPDAGPVDAGAVDAGVVDAGPVDAGPGDAGPLDAGPEDAGSVDAGPEDAGLVDAGPPDSGAGCPPCPANEYCDATDGECYRCLEDEQCSVGEICAAHACVTAPSACSGCSLLSCPVPGLCLLPFDGGEVQCLIGCQTDSDCIQAAGYGGYGYLCEDAGLGAGRCLPNPIEITSCTAPAVLGQVCESNVDCVAAGLAQGVCAAVDGGRSCTVACTPGSALPDCPLAWSCDAADGGFGLCVPPLE